MLGVENYEEEKREIISKLHVTAVMCVIDLDFYELKINDRYAQDLTLQKKILDSIDIFTKALAGLEPTEQSPDDLQVLIKILEQDKILISQSLAKLEDVKNQIVFKRPIVQAIKEKIEKFYKPDSVIKESEISYTQCVSDLELVKKIESEFEKGLKECGLINVKPPVVVQQPFISQNELPAVII